MRARWPPPPDLDSIKQLTRDADIEGFIADGAPADEYDTEAEDLFRSIQHFATKELVAVRLMPILKRIWAVSFNVSGDELESRIPALEGLAQQIARFFGPEATPQVRNFIEASTQAREENRSRSSVEIENAVAEALDWARTKSDVAG